MDHIHLQPSSPEGRGARTLLIPFKPPYGWEMLIRFLQPRAIPGLEVITGAAYKRVFRIGEHSGILEIRPSPGQDSLQLTISPDSPPQLSGLAERVARLFDCAADPAAVSAHLGSQPLMRKLVPLHPGMRVPGAFDGFEIAVRAVLGQQITVSAATTMAGRLVAAFGTNLGRLEPSVPAHLFPSSSALAEADLTTIGLTRAKAMAISALARRHLSEPSLLEPSSEPGKAIAQLVDLPGIGNWTAQYIAMRALRDPDAFPASDLGLRRALSKGPELVSAEYVERKSLAWRPWRAYAAMHLWATLT